MTGRPVAWRNAPPRPRVAPGEVHVWRAALDVDGPSVRALRRTLAPEDLERAERYRCPREQSRFIVARAALRSILGRYLDAPPREIPIATGREGKPYLAVEGAARFLHFNLSHADGTALYAVGQGVAVGIDVECPGAPRRWEDVARRFCSPEAYEMLCRAPRNRRRGLFFAWWTHHEARIKACGEPLSVPIPAPSRSPEVDGNGDWRRTPREASATGCLEYGFTPRHGYVAALAVHPAARPPGLRWWRWDAGYVPVRESVRPEPPWTPFALRLSKRAESSTRDYRRSSDGD